MDDHIHRLTCDVLDMVHDVYPHQSVNEKMLPRDLVPYPVDDGGDGDGETSSILRTGRRV